jgi:hypothetical protein
MEASPCDRAWGLLASAAGMLPLVLAAGIGAAELGDINGDGRVTPGDGFLYDAWRTAVDAGETPAFAPAPGSAEFEQAFSCSYLNGGISGASHMQRLLLFESLRRVVDAPLPHFIERWPEPEAEPAPAPPPDSRVSIRIAGATQALDTGFVQLSIAVETTVELDAIAVVFRGKGIDIRPGHPGNSDPFPEKGGRLSPLLEAYLISGGLCVGYSCSTTHAIIAPPSGIRYLTVEVPKGTVAWPYQVDFLEITEVVTSTGEVIRPVVLGDTFELERDVARGHELPFPPLDFTDLEARAIGGGVELSLTDVEGSPGDIVSATLMLRAERPVNYLEIEGAFDARAIKLGAFWPLTPDPVTGEVSSIEHFVWTFNGDPRIGFGGKVGYTFRAEGLRSSPYSYDEYQPSLRFLAPLGEWIPLAEISVAIESDPSGTGVSPLKLDVKHAEFVPYISRKVEHFWVDDTCPESGAFWSLEPAVGFTGRVIIHDPSDPPPPPDPPIPPEVAGIYFDLGDAEGKPGDVVSVPVAVETGVELWQVRLVVGFDSARLELVGFEADIIDPLGQPGKLLMAPEAGEFSFLNQICEGEAPERECHAGKPFIGLIPCEARGDKVPEGIAIIDLMTTHIINDGPQPAEMESWSAGASWTAGALLFRIHEECPGGVTLVEGVSVSWLPERSVVETESVSSGYPVLLEQPTDRADVPAVEVSAGRILVVVEEDTFLRGDVDDSGRVELTDAIRTLGVLFLGAQSDGCDDAADSNDDGAVNISDPVHTLQHLFLGGPAPARPFPERGTDPSEDNLVCRWKTAQ